MSQGYEILDSRSLAPKVIRLVVHAPHVVRRCGPGQFVIVRAAADGERIPLTIAQSNRRDGTITLVVQEVGASTRQICALVKGDHLADVVGPLGHQTDIHHFGHAVVVGGGVGTAVVFPQAAALKAKGNHVSAIIGGRSREYVILERELSEICDAVYPCTDDGSYGRHGFVTDELQATIERQTPPVDAVFAAGPVPMMHAIAKVTRPYAIHTIVSLNPIMVDGTGMCGGCRVRLGEQMKFACVDGPEFDAHQVDFEELISRLSTYRTQEQQKTQSHPCKLVQGENRE